MPLQSLQSRNAYSILPGRAVKHRVGKAAVGEHSHACRLNLQNILLATDFSPASAKATISAISLARRHQAKLYLAHVVGWSSEKSVMDGWRTGQAEIMAQELRNRLDGVDHELLVAQGDVWPALSQIIGQKAVGLLVLGTRGRTGVRKFMLGSVAETIFRHASCPVLTVGPNMADTTGEETCDRILAPTGFARHSQLAVAYATKLAQDLASPLALLNVATKMATYTDKEKQAAQHNRIGRLQALIPADINLAAKPELFVEFGSATERVLAIANLWKASMVVLGLHDVPEALRRETSWGKAYEIICQAPCPVLTLRMS